MAGWTYKIEIWTEQIKDHMPGAPYGVAYYSWAMPVYKDDGGDYITFELTHLSSILGKIYIADLVVEHSCQVNMPTTTGVKERKHVVR